VDKHLDSEIVIYNSEAGAPKIEVRLQNETLWLTQAQLGELFQTSKANVSEHMKQLFGNSEQLQVTANNTSRLTTT
jgi:hypothetical protein